MRLRRTPLARGFNESPINPNICLTPICSSTPTKTSATVCVIWILPSAATECLGHGQRLLASGWWERKVKLREVLSLQAQVQRRSIFANMAGGSRARDCADAIRLIQQGKCDLGGGGAGCTRRHGP